MFDWSFPYPSRRAPVLARNVVATSQPLAASAGLDMLRQGGNAVDAALATAITLTVVEPCNNGVGSDAFAIVSHGGELTGLNASGKSPAAWTAARFRGPRSHAGQGLGRGDGARRGKRVGRPIAAVWQTRVRRSVRTGDPVRARRLPRRPQDGGDLGLRRRVIQGVPGFPAPLFAVRAGAATGRGVHQS